MSVFEKCLALGVELRNSAQGKEILALKSILAKNREKLYLFNSLINKHYISEHFFAPMHALLQLRGNKDNEHPFIQKEIAETEEISEVAQFANACSLFGKMCNNISALSVGNTVMYSMPDNMVATPEAIRLLNKITVECLQLPLVKRVIQKAASDQSFIEMAQAYETLNGNKQISPYTQEDRKILKILSKQGFSRDNIIDMYSFLCLLTYIKAMIFDAFFDNVFVVDENSDVISMRKYQLTKAQYVVYKLKPAVKTMSANSGWFLKIIHSDGSISFGQLFNKHICIKNQDSNLEGTTIHALLFGEVK